MTDRIANVTPHPLSDGYAPSWASAWGHDRYGPWAEFELWVGESCVTQRLRWIPAGSFQMGSPESDKDSFDREHPQHEVKLTNGYWLFDTPCTQELWLAVMGGKTPSHFQGDRHPVKGVSIENREIIVTMHNQVPDLRRPVEKVSYEDAGEFIVKLNGLVSGLDLSLPTESQWEYACRAGTTEPRYGALGDVAWYSENSDQQTHDVGQKLANSWGLYDMLGNVYEWCLDGQRDYTRDVAVNPVGPVGAGSARVIRGGSWNVTALDVRAAYRIAVAPGHRNLYVGFRCLSSGR